MPPRDCSRKNWCRLPTCSSTSFLNPDLKFYYFPRNRDIQKKWLEVIGIPEWKTFPWNKLILLQLCSLHFDESCITPYRHMYPTAVPSLLLFPEPSEASTEQNPLPSPPPSGSPEEASVRDTSRCANCGQRGLSDSWKEELEELQNLTKDSSDSKPQKRLRSSEKSAALSLDLSIPDLLNSILKLPSPNLLTNDIRLCAHCLPVLAKILALFNRLQEMSEAHSALSTVFKDLEQMHLLVLDNTAEQLEFLRNEKEVRDKNKQNSSTPTTQVAQTSALSFVFPVLERPVIIKTEPISATPGFSQPRETPSPDDRNSDWDVVVEPMEDPLALGDIPRSVPGRLGSAKKTNPKVIIIPTEKKKRKPEYFQLTRRMRLEKQRLAEAALAPKEPEANKGLRKRKNNTKVYTHPPCPHCGKVFNNRYNKGALTEHIQIKHSYISKYKCDICEKPCRSPTAVNRHRVVHMNEEERSKSELESFLCPECGRMLKSDRALQGHLETHVDMETRLLRCPEQNCDYSTLCATTLKRHSRLHDPNAETPFKCTKCGEAFKFMRILKYHVMKDCAAPDRVHACDLPGCGKRFKWKQGLVLHYVSRIHGLSAEEAREKVYPGLPCPDWVEAQINKNSKR